MSTVRMSDYLRRDIVNKFEDSHQKSNPKLELDATRGDAIYNRYIGPKVEAAKEAMREHLGDIVDPDAMFSKTSNLTCLVPINYTSTSSAYEDEDMTSETELEEDYRISIPLSTERAVPMGVSTSSYSSSMEHLQYTFNRYEDADLNYLCECVEYNSKVKAQRDIAGHKVNMLLLKFTTLNQAMKAWPALSKLVEPEKLAKVHEKQQRKRKQEQQKEMADQVVVDNDLNKTILTASLIGDE